MDDVMAPTGHEVLQVLYLFLPAYVANMAPVLARELLPSWSAPIDGGRTFRGRRILGAHKTWRGLATGVLGGVLVFEAQAAVHRAGLLPGLALIDYGNAGLWPGLLLGLGALVGDAVKSFFKRQVGIAPGESWIGPDQLDFMAGAYAFLCLVYVPPLVPVLAALPIVLVGDLLASAIGFSIGLKEAWI
jgi:CDP-2,3-bis-(O-geranylgeranyl)-sn-glycerol synthase